MSRAPRLLLLAAVLSLGTARCVTPGSADPEALVTEAGTVHLEFVEWNESTSDLLKESVPVAAKVLSRWGGLTEPVRITVVNSRWELEEAAGRRIPGISAWARRNQVVLWDPRWWPTPPGMEQDPTLAARVRRSQLTGLLKHELTHCLMFQRAGGPRPDPGDRIPFWFREGMATVTAGEGSQWPPPESLSQWLAAHPGVDLLRDASTIVRTDPAVAYGAAYAGFDFLVRRYGDATVLRVLERMRAPAGYPDAFQEATGVTVESFGTDFQRYLSWRGFVPAAAPAPPASRLSAPRPAGSARSPGSAAAVDGRVPPPPAAARSP